MTECDSQKMRSLMITHLGKKGLEEYDEIVKNCKLGKALKDERTWAPLCPEYPNLKGVTCEEIEDFLEGRRSGFIGTKKFYNYINDIFYIDASEKDILEFIKQNTDKEEFDKIAKDTTGMNRDEMFSHFVPRDEVGTEIKREPREFTEEYLRHVRVYDRDEAYEAFKDIGDWIEVDNPGILKDPSTIFVTTPTGGHEMLSIFAYANDIDKSQIPSDIKFQHITTGAPVSEESYKRDPISATKYIQSKGYEQEEEIPTDVYGQTWLYNRSHHVKNIFIVDDIIASGEQIHKTAMSLEEMFPGANINSVTLCKRSDDVVSPALPYKIKKYYTDAETIGINSFKDRRLGGVVGKEYITCGFQHCCPDGESDKLMVELMGSERCSPEKRISRRDL